MVSKKNEGRHARFLNAFMTVWEILKGDASRPPSDIVIEGYYKILESYDIADVEKAFGAALGTMKWFPKPVELRDLIEADQGLVISIEARAQQEWRGVMSAVRQLGAGRPPRFLDPVTAHLVRTQFTWSYLCGMLEENENWEQKRWCEAFDLADSIHEDLLEIEVPDKVRGLLDVVARPVAVPGDFAQGRITIPAERKTVDRESRIAKLRAQASVMLEEMEKGVDV